MPTPTTALITDDRYLRHDQPQHVERAARLQAIHQQLHSSGLRDRCAVLAPQPAVFEQLLAAHTGAMLTRSEQFGAMGGGQLDADTYMTDESWDVAVLAAGGAVRLTEAVLAGEYRNGFALVRPPGHHATPSQAMGFCLIDNIAVAARAALQHDGINKVAIVDYDVHHGNGTQDIFYNDPQVLFCSTHAFPFYPGTGAARDMGMGDARGTTLNVPLPMGTGDSGYERVFDQVIVPALHAYQPDMLLVSAGYDAHWSDPLGPMTVTVAGFAQMTHKLLQVADDLCAGRLVLVLEGGYNLDGLAHSVAAALAVLLGDAPATSDPLGHVSNNEPDISGIIEQLISTHPLLMTT